MSAPAYTRTEIELLLFELGGAMFGADASQVLRIDRPATATAPGEAAPTEVTFPAASAPLKASTPSHVAGRSLVFRTPQGFGQLKVDVVWGVRQVAVDALRRLPAAAATQPYAIGVWLDGDKPVLLIDLVEMHRTQGRQ